MLELIAFVVGFGLGYYVNSHFASTVTTLKADLQKEFDALKKKVE